jgi:hypothetical protein
MFKMVPWSLDLDLTEFYIKAEAKGFKNNSTQQMLIDCFANERHKQIWILYYDNKAVGSVAAHSLDLPQLGEDAYRICARTCILTDELPLTSLRTISGIINHQNYTAQYLIPACISWTPPWGDLYITSTENAVGSQRLVNRIFCPALEATGVLEFAGKHLYRNTEQSFWKVNVNKFNEELDTHGRWTDIIFE